MGAIRLLQRNSALEPGNLATLQSVFALKEFHQIRAPPPQLHSRVESERDCLRGREPPPVRGIFHCGTRVRFLQIMTSPEIGRPTLPFFTASLVGK